MTIFKQILSDLLSSDTLKHLAAEALLAVASVVLADAATYFTQTALDPQTALLGRAAVGFAKRIVDAAKAQAG